jgi:hypothetical protein
MTHAHVMRSCRYYNNIMQRNVMHSRHTVPREIKNHFSKSAWGGGFVVCMLSSAHRRVDPKIFFCLNDAARRSIPQHKVRIT